MNFIPKKSVIFLLGLICFPGCVGLQNFSSAEVHRTSYREGQCAPNYEGSATLVTQIQDFDIQQSDVSVIGDVDSLQYWRYVGRSHDSFSINQDDDVSYRSFYSFNCYYGCSDNDFDPDGLANILHVYGNIQENEYFDLTINVNRFLGEDSAIANPKIYDFVIFQVLDDYDPSECEPNENCTERTQVGNYDLGDVEVTEIAEGRYQVSVSFELRETTEHYPQNPVISFELVTSRQEGVITYPEISYECDSTYDVYNNGGSVVACEEGYTDVNSYEASEVYVRICDRCSLTRNGQVQSNSSELDQHLHDDGIAGDCLFESENSFSETGSLE